jgi:N-acetylneuraminic acid mutarotase
MSCFVFQDKLYLFGGEDEDTFLNDLFVLDLQTNNWKELDLDTPIIEPTYDATTTMVATSGTNLSCNVYVIGGGKSYRRGDYHTKIMKFELKDFRSFWLLHLLKITGVSNLIHYHMCLDLVLMYQENNLDY